MFNEQNSLLSSTAFNLWMKELIGSVWKYAFISNFPFSNFLPLSHFKHNFPPRKNISHQTHTFVSNESKKQSHTCSTHDLMRAREKCNYMRGNFHFLDDFIHSGNEPFSTVTSGQLNLQNPFPPLLNIYFNDKYPCRKFSCQEVEYINTMAVTSNNAPLMHWTHWILFPWIRCPSFYEICKLKLIESTKKSHGIKLIPDPVIHENSSWFPFQAVFV